MQMSVGTTPYSYLWSNQATSQNINQLSQSYSLMVTDNKGCQVNASTTIEDLQYQLNYIA